MPERPLIEQLEDALSGDHAHNVVRVWAWIRVAHAGEVQHDALKLKFADARSVLADGLRLSVFRVTSSKVLTNEWPQIVKTVDKSDFARGTSVRPIKRKTRKGDAPASERLSTLTGRDKVRYAFDHRSSKECQLLIRQVTARVARAYVIAYKARTGREYWPAMVVKSERNFRMVARWCTEQGIRYAEWFRFCDKTYRQKTKVNRFPAPANCSGPWVAEQWLEEHSPKDNRNAGHTYREVSKDTREMLTGAGFNVDKHDDDMLEYIESKAKDKTELPETMYTADSEDIEKLIDWLVLNRGS